MSGGDIIENSSNAKIQRIMVNHNTRVLCKGENICKNIIQKYHARSVEKPSCTPLKQGQSVKQRWTSGYVNSLLALTSANK